MKNITVLLLLVLAGCANNRIQEQPSTIEESPVSKKTAMIEVTSGSVKMSVVRSYYAFVEDVVIDITKDGVIYTTYTDLYSGNRVTVEGDCNIFNLQNYQIRDWRNK
jgi:hypothetical protein